MEKQRVRFIETPRLILRRFQHEPKDSESRDGWMKDVHFFSELRTDVETRKWASDGKVDRDLAATEEYLRGQVDIAWAFIIELKTQQEIDAWDEAKKQQEVKEQDQMYGPNEIINENKERGRKALELMDQDEALSNPPASSGIKTTEPTKPRHTSVEGRQILGALGIKVPVENVKYAERLTQPMLGYLMHADSRGHGYATEAARGLITAFWRRVDQLQKHQGFVYDWTGIEALTDTANAPSTAVLNKLGFQYVRLWPKMFYSPLLESDRDVAHYHLHRQFQWPIEIKMTPSEPSYYDET